MPCPIIAMPPIAMPEPVVDTPPAPETREYRVGECVVIVDDSTRGLLTRFADGSVLFASPEDTDAYRETAAELGYGTDTWSFCVDRALTFSWLAHTLSGLPRSPTLWTLANPGRPGGLPRRHQDAEETRVCAFQRFARTGQGREYLGCLRDAVSPMGGEASRPIDPDGLRDRFLAWRDGTGEASWT
jgi:hypothetical protein